MLADKFSGLNRRTVVAIGSVVLASCLFLVGKPSQAQTTAEPLSSIVDPVTGHISYTPNELDATLFSQFELLDTRVNIHNAVENDRASRNGELIAYYHTLILSQPDDPHETATKTLTLGGWYWFNSGSNNLFAVSGSFGLTKNWAIQIDEGGQNETGFNQTYGFVLYTPTNAFLDKPSRTSLTLGVGPYYQGRKVQEGPTGGATDADTRLGYTGLAQINYLFAKNLSLQGSVWYLSYQQRNPSIGLDNYVTSSLYRFNTGLSLLF
jgi:hypothetical protein